jgi:hypothetical protein
MGLFRSILAYFSENKADNLNGFVWLCFATLVARPCSIQKSQRSCPFWL